MQHPGRPQRPEQRRAIALLKPGAGGKQRLAEERGEAARAALPGFARDDLEHAPGPQRAAEQREQERRVGAEPPHVGGEARPVAWRQRVERRDIAGAVHREDLMAAVRQQHAGRQRRVREFESARRQVAGQRGIGGRGDEQHEGRRHDVMDEAGRGDRLGADAPADALVALQHEDALALLAEQRGGHQRVDPAAHDHIVGRHARALFVY